jgi:hypothetical protein
MQKHTTSPTKSFHRGEGIGGVKQTAHHLLRTRVLSLRHWNTLLEYFEGKSTATRKLLVNLSFPRTSKYAWILYMGRYIATALKQGENTFIRQAGEPVSAILTAHLQALRGHAGIILK